MQVDLTPLRLTKEEERRFCEKRIAEQNEHIQNLFDKPDSQRRYSLIHTAKIIKEAFYSYLYTVLIQ